MDLENKLGVTGENLGDNFIYSTLDNNYDNFAIRIGSFAIGKPTAEQKKKMEAAKKKAEDRKARKSTVKGAAKKEKQDLIKDRAKIKAELKAKGGNWRKEWRKVRKEYGGSTARKVLQFQNTMALVPNRNAFLALVRVNMFNMAYNLAKHEAAKDDKWKKAINKWAWLGGDLVALKVAIEAGKLKKPVFAKYKATKGADGLEDGFWVEQFDTPTFSGAGYDDAAYIALASSIIAAMASVVGKGMDKKTAEAVKDTASIELEKMQLTEEQKLDLENTMDEDEDDEWISGIPNAVTIIGGVVVLGGIITGIYYATKKN